MTSSDINRFWQKVDKKTDVDCWNWMAFVDKHGYPRLNINGKIEKAHQISALLHIGPRLPNMCVCHTCDNRKCVNPRHLFYATQARNLEDMYNKGRNRQPKGTKAARSKLTLKQVDDLKQEYANGKISSRKLGLKYDLTHSAVLKIIKGITYKSGE